MEMDLKKGYKLTKGIQVRNEAFGLLFYNYAGPRLYFVPSRNLLTDRFFNGRQSIDTLAQSLCASMKQPAKSICGQLAGVLEKLEEKGLIYGQPIC